MCKFDCQGIDDALNFKWPNVMRGEFLGFCFEGDVFSDQADSWVQDSGGNQRYGAEQG